MSCDYITFYNWSNTYWIDKEWAKIESMKRQRENLILIDKYFPKCTNRQKANKIGMSYGYYMQLRKEYGLI